jgi:hypothetical protein
MAPRRGRRLQALGRGRDQLSVAIAPRSRRWRGRLSPRWRRYQLSVAVPPRPTRRGWRAARKHRRRREQRHRQGRSLLVFRRRQSEIRSQGCLLKSRFAAMDRAQDPALEILADPQPDHVAGRRVETDRDAVGAADDGTDKRERNLLRRRGRRGQHRRRDGKRGRVGAGGRREGEKIGRSRVAVSALSEIPQSGLPIGGAGAPATAGAAPTSRSGLRA